jgi:hypothetical protein
MLQASRKSFADLQREQMARVAAKAPAMTRDVIEAAAWRVSSERLCRTIPLVRTYPSPTRYEYDRRVLGIHGWVPVDVLTLEKAGIRATYRYTGTPQTADEG